MGRQPLGTGIFGGSFNPPHAGHRALVLFALRRFRLRRVRVLVSPQNPLKPAGLYTPLEERLTITREAMRGLPSVSVEPEAETGPVYAADTVERLRREERGSLVYLVGADSFASLHRWARWREIMERLPVGVVSRPGYRLKALTSPAARVFVSRRLPERRASLLPLSAPPAWCYVGGLERSESSTRIRERPA